MGVLQWFSARLARNLFYKLRFEFGTCLEVRKWQILYHLQGAVKTCGQSNQRIPLQKEECVLLPTVSDCGFASTEEICRVHLT